jgi:hypothetical protein
MEKHTDSTFNIFLFHWKEEHLNKLISMYLYCCTLHSEDSLIIKTNKCNNMYYIYSKTHIKTFKKLLHVSIYRSSSGSTYTCSSLLKYVKMLK